ncbi:hypothetical protein T484DRAFT_1800785, partial [Baffinella frigidus]
RALSGTSSRLCTGGIANFDDLRISFASGNYSLFFSAPAMSLTVESRFFSVEADAYAGVTISQAPSAAVAGVRLDVIRLFLSDRFGNPTTTGAAAQVVITAELVGSSCCTHTRMLLTSMGGATLQGSQAFTLTVAGEYRLSARLEFDMQECVDGQAALTPARLLSGR